MPRSRLPPRPWEELPSELAERLRPEAAKNGHAGNGKVQGERSEQILSSFP